MSFFKLIINNVLRSARTYGSYFLASTFSVFVFFTFAMLTFHPQMANGINGSSDNVSQLANLGMAASQVLIVLLSIVFLWYSFWTFVKARKRDLGIYLMLGMKPKDLRKILFGENMLLGVASIFTGVSLGVLFTKVILIVIQNLLGITTGLAFYFPAKGILLTISIFLLLYLFISTVMTFRIETENLNQLGKSDETPQPLPKTHPVLVVLAFVALVAGYGSLWAFVHNINGYALTWILACVLLTVFATFLFFHQVVVYFYKWTQHRGSYWQGEKLLGIAEGIYKAKENATMYALIACTASVALVGISVTSALGSSETGSRNSVSAAYVLDDSVDNDGDGQASLEMGEKIVDTIKQAGHEVVYEIADTYPTQYFPKGIDEEDGTYMIYAMKASDYNRVAKALGGQELHPAVDELISPASSAAEQTEIKNKSAAERQESMTILTRGNQKKQLTVTQVPTRFRIATMYRFLVAPDELVADFAVPEEYYGKTRFQIIDFKEWQSDEEVNQKILTLLNERQEQFTSRMKEIESDDTLSTKAREAAYEKNFSENYISYQSRFEVWQRQRQDNGLILMIGVLLGGVFFIFTASIMYFRLFGDLDKEGRYHRSLYQIGLQPKQRHQIVTKQMMGMFFIPMIVATLHSAVAYWGIVQLASLSIWHYFFIIIACYVALMAVLFLICRWRYLVHLDNRAENPQAF